MNLTAHTCAQCGAVITVDQKKEAVTCEYCDTVYNVDIAPQKASPFVKHKTKPLHLAQPEPYKGEETQKQFLAKWQD